MSRSSRPKHFLSLTGETSLYKQSLRRVLDPTRYTAPIIVTNAEYRFLAAEQALEIGVVAAAILLEPIARNTAAAIAVAAVYVSRVFGVEAVIHVLASDHAVTVDDNYDWSIAVGTAAARKGWLVTFGIDTLVPQSFRAFTLVTPEG